MSVEPWSVSAFEDRYRNALDPWDFAGSSYEQARYDAILSGLQRKRYGRGYEPGCSVGVLTARLAPRCEQLLAIDVSATAVERARQRCQSMPHVKVEVGSVVDEPPVDLDLVVFSEIGYYFDVVELDQIVERLARVVQEGGDLLACHWLGESPDHQLHGSVVHQRLDHILRNGFVVVHHAEVPEFVIDVWRRG